MLLLFAASASAAEQAPNGPPPDYNRQIAPIFKQYCQGCHNAQDKEGGLVLDTYDALLRGGDGGVALQPGNSDQSRLLLVLTGKAEPAMPPEGNEGPTAAEVALLKAWVAAGAKGPSGKAPDPTVLVTPKVELLAPARRVLNAATISPDGKLAALAGYGELRLISLENRQTIRTLGGHRGNVTDVSFSADGGRIISAAGEPGVFGEVKIWNTADGAPLRTIVGHADSLYAADLSPDGKWIATASYDQQIKLWDAATGKELRTLSGHNGAVFDVAFSPNGKLLASASADRTVKLWDAATGARLDTFGQPLKEVYAVTFSPDGKRVAAGGVDNRIRIWQLSDSAKEGTNPLLFTRFAHEGAIIRLAYSRDGKTLASSAEDRTVRVWNAERVEERRSLETQPDWPAALAVGPDNKTLLVGRADGSFALYNAENGKAIPPPKPELASLWPRGVQRGATVKLQVRGKNLLGASAVKFNHAQLAGKILASEAERADVATVEVTAAAALPRGSYQLSLVTPGGTSAPVAIEVDDLPQLVESEPNNQPSQAAAMSVPLGLWGTLAAKGDVDHVRFDAKAGQMIVCELSAKRLGSALNGMLAIVDPAGQVVATNNDFDGQEDPLVAYRIPADGRYAVRINDLARDGSDKHFYRLSLGELPLVTGCFPMSVPAEKESELQLSGYNLPADAKVKLPVGPAGDRNAPIDQERFRTVRSLTVLATSEPELVESEPNDAPEQATQIVAPGNVNGRIHPTGDNASPDIDLYRFESKRGQSWIIETLAGRRGSPADTKIEVLDAEGKPLERLLLQAVRDSYIEFRGVDSNGAGVRPKNWEEMELNELVYMHGEVVKVFRMPQGPDSDMQFYTLGGLRRCYFDTSATSHALGDPIYTVEPHAPDDKLVPNGLPVFPLYYANDDESRRTLGRDSRLTFTAPADGAYLVRVSDVRNFGGDRFVYRLSVREPKPDFQIKLADVNPTVNVGGGRRLTFRAERSDGFEGDIMIDIAGLPQGFRVSSPIVIQAGHVEARAVLYAAEDAVAPPPEAWKGVVLTARGEIGGQNVTKEVNSLGQVKLETKPSVVVRLEPAELTIAPGTTITATLKVERNGFKDRISFDADNLPHGVIVDNIGLNGVLIPEGQTERQIFLTCAKWVENLDRPFHAVASNAGAQASPPVMLHVRRGDTVAQAPQGK
ncbi:MAG TPA: c-type cytochrome domain-containing protein [Pirellulales bacterium]|nr:c-type cytochrome domain-containing protein [Pirellulales bacterium]